MKPLKILLAIILLFAFAACSNDEPMQNDNLSLKFDNRFALFLMLRGYVEDASYITQADVDNIKKLDVSGCELKSLRGIEFMTSLTELQCYANRLSSLDISKNTKLETLYCADNSLTDIRLGENANISYLSCQRNNLTSLDLRYCKSLTYLNCVSNPGKNSSFEVAIYPGTGLKIWKNSWDYDGQTITVKLTQK